jgi:(S)-mandelate dehydrogenase
MTIDRAVSVHDVQRLAKNRLPAMAYDFIAGGCDDEFGLAASETTFRDYRLVPRYLRDVARPRTAATACGQTFAMPYGISPTGAAEMFRRGADAMLAAEAVAANVPFILSSASNASIEEIMRVAPYHTWFQIYGARDPKIAEDMIRRAVALNVKTLVVSLDVPVTSNRERNRRNRFSHPLRVTPSMIFQAITHPGWTMEYFSNGGLPTMGNWRPYAGENPTPQQVTEFFVTQFPAPALTWSALETYRGLWPRKLLVKGVLHPDDAGQAVGLGVDGIIVSNHGGRQLDRAPSPLEALPGVVAAVGGQAEVMLDGGIRRGSDIVIARCLGAGFVFAGRPTLYGAAAAGRAGVKKVLDIFAYELGVILAQIGCADIADLGPHYLLREAGRRLEAVGPSEG